MVDLIIAKIFSPNRVQFSVKNVQSEGRRNSLLKPLQYESANEYPLKDILRASCQIVILQLTWSFLIYSKFNVYLEAFFGSLNPNGVNSAKRFSTWMSSKFCKKSTEIVFRHREWDEKNKFYICFRRREEKRRIFKYRSILWFRLSLAMFQKFSLHPMSKLALRSVCQRSWNFVSSPECTVLGAKFQWQGFEEHPTCGLPNYLFFVDHILAEVRIFLFNLLTREIKF